jgi:hypothetical protein
MGIPVMILGKSGAGKSSSLRNLDPLTYSVVEVNGKPLPFKTKKKAIHTDDYAKVSRVLNEAPTDVIVIDDSQYLMANEFMRRAREKGYEKFSEIGQNFWNLINEVAKLPAEKIVYFFHHIETDEYGVSKEKTIGKMLDDKICLAGMFTIVLLAEKVDDKYLFDTQNDGRSPAKTPMGMFSERTIDNDLVLVDKAVREFYDLPAPRRMEEKPA